MLNTIYVQKWRQTAGHFCISWLFDVVWSAKVGRWYGFTRESAVTCFDRASKYRIVLTGCSSMAPLGRKLRTTGHDHSPQHKVNAYVTFMILWQVNLPNLFMHLLVLVSKADCRAFRRVKIQDQILSVHKVVDQSTLQDLQA